VSGCVDGTDIKIDAPYVHEEAYVDRHNNHSMNLTAVCGASMQFLWISCRWPGSVYDAKVLRNSTLWRAMENATLLPRNSIILADPAYPLTVSMIFLICNMKVYKFHL
jgi:DDE superfamily endonuclease